MKESPQVNNSPANDSHSQRKTVWFLSGRVRHYLQTDVYIKVGSIHEGYFLHV